MRLLAITPPMTQLNTPYPATPYITAFLRSHNYTVAQEDFSLDLALRIFSAQGLDDIGRNLKGASEGISFFKEALPDYKRVVDMGVQFLQGKAPSLAHRIATRSVLPEGPKFYQTFSEIDAVEEQGFDPIKEAFGELGVQDKAKFIATLFINDIAAVVAEGIDARFGLSRYGERLAASQSSFDELESELESKTLTLLDEYIDELTVEALEKHKPDVVLLTAPFPGNVYGALRIARGVKKHSPSTVVFFGGGYANTELRELEEPRIFNYVDAITLDDGAQPLLALLESLKKSGLTSLAQEQELLRTFVCKSGVVTYVNSSGLHDIPQKDLPAPTYDGLRLDEYLMLTEMLNPMHRLWSDARWNKLIVAHGCYWKKCNFCDVTLDYIGRYELTPVERTVNAMEALIKETGETGFHFVDEAAPPAALGALAKEIIKRGLVVSWWGNVRFEKAFTPELCSLLAESGCIALTGGLEVADNRLLKLINKGVDVDQVTKVTKAMTQAGILVHAYLMYGFPTQTPEETLSALDRVRVLFKDGCIQSAFWHRFSATVHSPIGKNPQEFGIKILEDTLVGPRFARNDLSFVDSTGVDHGEFTDGLNRALYNYMHGLGLDDDVEVWFN